MNSHPPEIHRPATSRKIPGGTGLATRVAKGKQFSIVNTHGGQVVDTWALSVDGETHLSMAHTHTATGRLSPQVGDLLVDQRRRPMLRVVADTSPGVHDTLLAACDTQRYLDLGVEGTHRTCAKNFQEATADVGISDRSLPDPLNLFQRVAVAGDSSLSLLPSPAQPGATVTFEAIYDLWVVVSSCPMDVVAISATDGRPRDIEVVY